MGSLFDRDSSAGLLRRVESLGPESLPRWGKMDGGQMLKHCRRPIEVALGELKPRRALVGYLFGGIAKRYLVNGDVPFKPNMPTAAAFLVLEASDFGEEQRALVSVIKRVGEGRGESLGHQAHPLFGRLSPDEWDRLIFKHIDHHLRQFGV